MIPDAWKRMYELLKDNSTETDVRPDIKVEALGCDRAVRLSLRYYKGDDPMSLANEKWADTGLRNVSTMRELANALLAACDFVDSVNPEWAAGHQEIGKPPA
jgi:hypothetical protein